MAQQINFYSVTTLPSSPLESGIYFSQPSGKTTMGELYKGSQRFGAPRVTVWDSSTGPTTFSDIIGMVRGDIFVSEKNTYIYNGSEWTLLKVDHNENISGIVASLSVGNSNSYIKYISQGADGKVTAYAGTFPTLNLSSTLKTGISNGVTVSVTTQSGAVTGVSVTAPAYTATQVTKSGTSNGTTVSVTTKNGQVTGVEVTASDWTPGTATKSGSQNGVKVGVTTTSGVVTAVTVTNPFVATEVTQSGTSNGVTVSVTTKNGQVTGVSVAADEIANVMHFKGASTTLPSYASSATTKAGDIWIVSANPTGYITTSGWGSTTADGNTKLVAGQEYIRTSSGGFELIGDQNTYALKADKGQIGTSNSTLKGLKAAIELKSNASATITLTNDSLVTTSTGITTAADKLVTASAVANYVTGKLPTGGSGMGSTNGVWVSVSNNANAVPAVSIGGFGSAATKNYTTTVGQNGSDLPTAGAVYAFGESLISALDATSSSTSGPVKVTVQETDGLVTACTVTWDGSAGKNGVTGGSSTASAWTNGPSVKVDIASTTAAPTVTLTNFGSAAGRGVVTASGSFKTANYSNSLPTGSAVAAYVDGKIGALGATVTSTNGGLTISVTQTNGKLTAASCQFVWLNGEGGVIA